MFFLDIPQIAQIAFQNPASPIAEGIIDLHHAIFYYLLCILSLVLWMFFIIIKNSCYLWKYPTKNHITYFQKQYLIVNNLAHGTVLEIIWTLTPSIILMFIAIPSFSLLYTIDEVIDPKYTIKVIGHQWYWSYETPQELKTTPAIKMSENKNIFPNMEYKKFDSYMLPLKELKIGQLRLLEVDRPLECPINTHLRFIITALDVLHSFAIPSLGIKVDAVPGRLNQISVFIKREGIYYGQCSELCGVNHGFMPIKVIATNKNPYK